MDSEKKEILKIHKIVSQKVVKLPMFFTPVKAGFPSPAEDFIENKLDLNDFLISHPSETYLVKASGDSMKGAGINNGDILIVDRSPNPQDGLIAIAALNGEFTVKRIKKIKGELFLVPENSDFKPIKIEQDNELIIWGIVTYIIHKSK